MTYSPPNGEILSQPGSTAKGLAGIFRLHFLGGLTLPQSAQCEGISLSSAASAWLHAAMAGDHSDKMMPALGVLGRPVAL